MKFEGSLINNNTDDEYEIKFNVFEGKLISFEYEGYNCEDMKYVSSKTDFIDLSEAEEYPLKAFLKAFECYDWVKEEIQNIEQEEDAEYEGIDDYETINLYVYRDE